MICNPCILGGRPAIKVRRLHPMAPALAALLLLASAPAVQATDVFLPASSADLALFGAESKDTATVGRTAGDVNGDGFGDLILGAENAVFGGQLGAGRAYLIYGGANLPSRIDLAAAGNLGIVLVPGSRPGQLGHAVSAAGDFNGDGFDDFMVSAEDASSKGRTRNGVVYVVFGGRSLPSPLDLSALGPLGMAIHGKASFDHAGSSLSRAGDFNHDGKDDIIIGSRDADPAGRNSAGACHVIFGGTELPPEIDLAAVGAGGVEIRGVDAHDSLGSSVGFLGRFNGDDIDDIIVGAELACPAPGRPNAGRVSIIFGTANPPQVIEQGDLGAGGLTLLGAAEDDRAGRDVSFTGDFNRDGFDDALVGANKADPGGRPDAGKAYIIYGGATPPQKIDLLFLKAAAGVELRGIASNEYAGSSVAGIGDFDPDGFPDVLIGGPRANNGGYSNAGQAYLVPGSAAPPAAIELSRIGAGGMRITGEGTGDEAGSDVAPAGDINGDGGDDLIICSRYASPLHRSSAGTFYVFFGRGTPPPKGLSCTSIQQEVKLAWTNPIAYDSIRIVRNGSTLATLPGDSVSYTDAAPLAGASVYQVIGTRGSRESPPAKCELSIDVQPPFALACLVQNGQVLLSWAHRQDVDATRVYRDGKQIADLPASLRSYTDADPAPGAHTYKIVDVLGGSESAPIECSVVVPAPPADLRCEASGSDVTLRWKNSLAGGAPYTAVRILRDGLPLALLESGEMESFEDHGVPPGAHIYSVIGIIGEASSSAAECQVRIIGPPYDLAGNSIAGIVHLTWKLTETGDEVIVLRDGAPVGSLPGNALAFSEGPLSRGSYRYEVLLRIGSGRSAPAAGTVEVVDPVVHLQGSGDGNAISLTWELGDVYDFLEVRRDGNLPSRLAGTALGFLDTVPGPGLYTYTVTGERGNGRSADATDAERVPIPPRNGTAILAGGTLSAAWINGEPYGAVQIFVNGAIQPDAPGDSQTFRIEVGPIGAATIEIRGIIDGNRSEPETVTASEVQAPRDLICKADGMAVQLRWTPGRPYDAVRIRRNGAPLAELPGAADSYLDTVDAAGDFVYQVRGVISGLETLPAECRLTVLPAPENLRCSTDGSSVTLEWTTSAPHDSVVITRNGEPYATIPAGIGSFTDAAPLPGVTRYGVRLSNGDGLGAVAACDVEILAGARDLACKAGGDRVLLSWTNPEGFNRMRIFRNGEEISPPGGLPGDTETFNDGPLAPGAYVYAVQHFKADEGAVSVPVSCRVEVLQPPSRLACHASDGVVELTWVNPQVYDAVHILRDGIPIDVIAGSSLLYTDPTQPLPPGTYVYEVRGAAGGSESASATCTVRVPDPVGGLTCRQEGDAILLSWTGSEAYDAVTIRRNGALITTLPGGAVRYEDRGLASDVYSYEVRGGIGGNFSVAARCTVDMIDGPAGLTCTYDGAAVRLAWTNRDAYDSISIRRNGALIQSLPGNAVEHIDAGLAAGTYEYTVAAAASGNISLPAVCSVQVTPALDPVLPPAGLECRIDGSAAHLSWRNGEAYDQVLVYRQGPGEAARSLIATLPGSAVSHDDSPILQPGDYRYEVEGKKGAASSLPAACTAHKPQGPGSIQCLVENLTASTGDVRLSWTNPEAYSSLVVKRNGEAIATLSGSATVFVDVVQQQGKHDYDIAGVIAGSSSSPAHCSIDITLPTFVRSNANCDRHIDIADGIFIINHLFLGGPKPCCLDAADANDDGRMDIADAILVILYQLKGGAPPPLPFPSRGIDPTEDLLDCAAYQGL